MTNEFTCCVCYEKNGPILWAGCSYCKECLKAAKETEETRSEEAKASWKASVSEQDTRAEARAEKRRVRTEMDQKVNQLLGVLIEKFDTLDPSDD